MYDSAKDTIGHIGKVREFISDFVVLLLMRAKQHDRTKLYPPEKAYFDKWTPKLSKVEYGSDEYRSMLLKMKPAIKHHQSHNRHHPEYHGYWECNGCFTSYEQIGEAPSRCIQCGYSQFQWREIGLAGMDLIDLIEMLCDWKAATLRSPTGDIRKSLEVNIKRFKMKPDILVLLENTINNQGW